jgi:hypothetical protein
VTTSPDSATPDDGDDIPVPIHIGMAEYAKRFIEQRWELLEREVVENFQNLRTDRPSGPELEDLWDEFVIETRTERASPGGEAAYTSPGLLDTLAAHFSARAVEKLDESEVELLWRDLSFRWDDDDPRPIPDEEERVRQIEGELQGRIHQCATGWGSTRYDAYFRRIEREAAAEAVEEDESDTTTTELFALTEEDLIHIETIIDLLRRRLRKMSIAEIHSASKLMLALSALPKATPGIDISISFSSSGRPSFGWVDIALSEEEFRLSQGAYTDSGVGGDTESGELFEARPGWRRGSIEEWLDAASDVIVDGKIDLSDDSDCGQMDWEEGRRV